MSKRGIATTEFWVHNIIQLVTLVMTYCREIEPQIAASIAAGLACIYIIARAIVKLAEAGAYPPADPPTASNGQQQSLLASRYPGE